MFGSVIHASAFLHCQTRSKEPPADAVVSEAQLYRESLRLRIRYYVLRGLEVLAIVYAVNALFNLWQVVHQGGFGALSQDSNVLQALLLNDLAALYGQLPAVILTVLGAVALAIIFSPAILKRVYVFVLAFGLVVGPMTYQPTS